MAVDQLNMANQAKPNQFSHDVSALETIVQQMESGTLSLEQSVLAYEQGMQLLQQCQQALSQAEQTIQILNANQTLVPFEAQD